MLALLAGLAAGAPAGGLAAQGGSVISVGRASSSFELAPYAGYLVSDDVVRGPLGTALRLSDGPLYGVQAGLALAPGVWLLGNVGHSRAELAARVPFAGELEFGASRTWVYDGGVQLALPLGGAGARPFLQFGAGGMRREVTVEGLTARATDFAYHAGAGLDLGLGPNLGLRLLARDYIGKFDFEEAVFLDRESRTMHNLALTAGLRLSF